MRERARPSVVWRAGVALLLLALCVGCGPRLLNLSFARVDVQAAAPKPPPPPPPPPPARVKVTEKQIEITERVEFETGSATILEASHGLLDEVVGVLKKHTDISLLEVQGHTDNTGKAKKNKALSKARASAVKKYLEEKGIDAKRLQAVGHGQNKPIAGNDSDEGKQKNRRVEFHILKHEEK
jgi:outer membrane protein OmpA-like peptidoglycan-associated protein